MSEFEIDKLFQRKLTGKEIKPSDVAWSKLEKQLANDRKGGKLFLWTAAASIAILLGAAFFILRNAESGRQFPVAMLEEHIPVGDLSEKMEKVVQPTFDKHENGSETIEVTNKERAEQHAGKQQTTAGDARKRIEQQNQKTSNNIAAKSGNITTDSSSDAIEDMGNREIDEVPVITETELVAENIAIEKTADQQKETYPEIKIIYKSSEKAHEDRGAFKKVVELARDIKEADIGLGTLREAKNDLLAFGFRKTKEN